MQPGFVRRNPFICSLASGHAWQSGLYCAQCGCQEYSQVVRSTRSKIVGLHCISLGPAIQQEQSEFSDPDRALVTQN